MFRSLAMWSLSHKDARVSRTWRHTLPGGALAVHGILMRRCPDHLGQDGFEGVGDLGENLELGDAGVVMPIRTTFWGNPGPTDIPIPLG